MSTSTDPASVPASPSITWTYAELRVIDNDRILRPTHVSFDRLIFKDPPHLVSTRVKVIVTNGSSESENWATVLPHDADATRIPIQLSGPDMR